MASYQFLTSTNMQIESICSHNKNAIENNKLHFLNPNFANVGCKNDNIVLYRLQLIPMTGNNKYLSPSKYTIIEFGRSKQR